MKALIRLSFVGGVSLLLGGVLLLLMNASPQPAVTANLFLTPTATHCPTATPEPFWVDPLTSPTRLLAQEVSVYLGNCEAVTISAESGLFTATDGCYPAPARVEVALLPNTVHHLEVTGKVRRVVWNGCVYGGYTLRTSRDKFGAPLVITQQFTATAVNYFPLVLKWRAENVTLNPADPFSSLDPTPRGER